MGPVPLRDDGSAHCGVGAVATTIVAALLGLSVDRGIASDHPEGSRLHVDDDAPPGGDGTEWS